MISDKLYLLRQQVNCSQEKFAERIGVSRQTVQRWESGSASPDLDSLVNIAKTFNVSLDWLSDLSNNRSADDLRVHIGPVPVYETDLRTEFLQALDEGRDVEALRGIVDAVSAYPAGPEKGKLADVLWQIMFGAPQRQDYPYREPDDLAAIRQLRRERYSVRDAALPEKDVLRDKLTGAWLGRVCGCMLGQPVEGSMTDELIPLLRATGNYPMHRYLTKADSEDPVTEKMRYPFRYRTYPDMLAHGFPGDDDTNYTYIGAYIIEKYGRAFTSGDVCKTWTSTQVIDYYFTAERAAYRNIIAGYTPPDTAVYKNPYREWIGAQIRGDYFGYINPGDPETAAEMAWRDARVSHVKNGIYGEMFVSAMNAAAIVCGDTESVLLCGMSQIPETSRLYERLQGVIDCYHSGKTWDDFYADFMKRYDEKLRHDAVHTLSNAEIVAAALLWGEGDFGKTICLAVQNGFDTDCNGATAGSIVGMLRGTAGIGREWSDPIGGIVNTSVNGQGAVRIDDFVDTILRHIGR